MDSQALNSGGSSRETEFYRNTATIVEFSTDFRKIKTEDKLYFGGSCFAVNLSDFWSAHYLPCSTAPFGNVYNPRSLKDCFTLLCADEGVGREDLFFHRELWRHPLFGTAMADTNSEGLTDSINSQLKEHRRLLKEADFLILTLGTAFVFDDKSTGKTVSNCHKRPASDFDRHPLTVEEIAGDLKALFRTVRTVNPEISLILTLSPVRHIRDRADENSLSKALLRCGMDSFLKEERKALYFPSSEIMLDELRDYRWYAEDLIHPSPTAVSYIMNRFCSSLGSEELTRYLKDAEKMKMMNDHRILFPETGEGRKFIEKREKDRAGFREKYPFARI